MPANEQHNQAPSLATPNIKELELNTTMLNEEAVDLEKALNGCVRNTVKIAEAELTNGPNCCHVSPHRVKTTSQAIGELTRTDCDKTR